MVFGLGLGWLLFNPPAFLQSLGVLAYGVNLLLCAVLLVSIVAVVIIANLPANVKTEPVSDQEVSPELHALATRLEKLGFRPAGPPCKVHIAPAAILLGFVHDTEPIYATIFRTDTVPSKTSYDFVSILHDDRGGLTTNADPGGASLPAGHSGLRQVFPGAEIETLLLRHREGIAYLRERGVHCRAVSGGTFQNDFKMALAKQRETFLASPLTGALVTLWRAATKQVPFVGTLRNQKIAQWQIGKLLATDGRDAAGQRPAA
jgi:hypothetical protein